MGTFRSVGRKNRIIFRWLTSAAVAGVIMIARGAHADVTYTAGENPNSFGHFDQDATDNAASPKNNGTFLITPNNPGVSAMGPAACAPTSAVNSFVFLQNQYGLNGLYNPGDPYGTISTLASPAYMNTAPAGANPNSQTGYSGGGTGPDSFRDGKEKYLQNIGPLTGRDGKQYAIQTVGQIDPGYGTAQAANGLYAGGVDAEIPTAEFIEQQLAEGEDVEMFFTWTDSEGNNGVPGHVVALTGINYDATTNSGSLSFIDPTNSSGGQIQYGSGDAPNINTLSLQELNNHLVFGYQGGASGIPADDDADAASYGAVVGVYAESPVLVPEPAAAAIFGSVLFGLAARRRKAH